MKPPQIIADSGAIVGLINRNDQWHQWAVENSAKLAPPFFTCEPAITEACYLLRKTPGGPQQVLGLVEAGHLELRFSLVEEAGFVRRLMQKYKDIPMAIADGCIVRMSELIEDAAVFTVDSDFRIYRRHGRSTIPLIIPDQI